MKNNIDNNYHVPYISLTKFIFGASIEPKRLWNHQQK